MSATEANQRWNRTEGVLIAPGTTSEEVAAVLDQERVLARLEWYPATEHLLSLTLLTDAEGRVAVTPPARGGVVAGLGVSELTEPATSTPTPSSAPPPSTTCRVRPPTTPSGSLTRPPCAPWSSPR